MKRSLLALAAFAWLAPAAASAEDAAPPPASPPPASRFELGVLRVSGSTAGVFASERSKTPGQAAVERTRMGAAADLHVFFVPYVALGGTFRYESIDYAAEGSAVGQDQLAIGPSLLVEIPLEASATLFLEAALVRTHQESGDPDSITQLDGWGKVGTVGASVFLVPALSVDARVVWQSHDLEDQAGRSQAYSARTFAFGFSVYTGRSGAAPRE